MEDSVKGQLFSSHGKTISCGEAVGYYGAKCFFLNLMMSIEEICFLEGEIDGEIYVLVNFYNNSIESDQIHTFSELNNFLDKVPDISIKK